ncbi:MAG: hemerythrin domain-containing protein [Planctomycetota bacterium]
MNLQPLNVSECRSLYETWCESDRKIREEAIRLLRWTDETEHAASITFSDAAQQLRRFQDFLSAHFEDEDQLSERFGRFYDDPHPELDAMRRQADRDHRLLLGRLDHLIEKLSAANPVYESWKEAEAEISFWVDQLEQHEDQESKSLSVLFPSWSEE